MAFMQTRSRLDPSANACSRAKVVPAETSHIAVWERDPQSLGVTGDELHDGAGRVQLIGMAPDVRNQNTVLVQFEA